MAAEQFFCDIDLNRSELINARLHNAAGTGSLASPAVDGQLYYDTQAGVKRIHFYDDTAAAWIPVPRLDQNMTVTGTWNFNPASGAPFTVGNSTKVTNLNADLLDGYNADTAATANTVAVRDSNGRLKFTDPSASDDGVNYGFLQGYVAGIRDPKDAARVATTANLSAARVSNVLTASANASINTAGIDGITSLAVNDRILVKNQSTGADNGLYIITSLGSAGTPWVMTRSSDADSSSKVTSGLQVWVTEGTTNGSTGWLLNTPDPLTLNTTALTFIQVNGTASITAGNGIVKVGNTLHFAQSSSYNTGGFFYASGASAVGHTAALSGIIQGNGASAPTAVSGTQYGLPYFATTTTVGSTAAGTSTQVLHGNAAGAPTWGAVSLTADVTGTLPANKGGTNLTSFTANAVLWASSTSQVATSSTLYWDGTSHGVGTATPRRTVDVLNASNPQMRLTYTDNSVYADFQATSTGHLDVTPSGGTRITSTVVNNSSVSARQLSGGLAFDGVSSGHFAQFVIPTIGTTDFTWSRTFLCPATTTGGPYLDVLMSSASSAAGYSFISYFSGTSLVFQLWGSSISYVRQALIVDFASAYGGSIVNVTATRSGATLTIYINGVATSFTETTSGVSPPASWADTINSTVLTIGNYRNAGTNPISTTVYNSQLFNRALSASEVITLANQGVQEADKWGSLTAKYTSNFSAGVDGWTAARAVQSYGVTYNAVSDCLSVYADSVSSTHSVYNLPSSSIGRGNWVLVSFDYAIPSGQSNVNNLGIAPTGAAGDPAIYINGTLYTGVYNLSAIADGTWRTKTILMKCADVATIGGVATGSLRFAILGMSGSASSFVGANSPTDDLFYIKNVTVTKLGCILDADLAGANPLISTTVIDRSSNAFNGTMTTTGISQRRQLMTQYVNGNIVLGPTARAVSTTTGNLTLSTLAGNGHVVVSPHGTGNVGIKTTGPDRALDVLDAASPQLRLTQADGTVYTDLQTNSSGYFLITPSAGYTLIGTTTAHSKLTVATSSLGTTQTNTSGLALATDTAAANGAQQISAALRFRGYGWKTNATAASQSVDFRMHVVPVQGTANPTGYLTFQADLNGAGYTELLRIGSTTLTATTVVITDANKQLASVPVNSAAAPYFLTQTSSGSPVFTELFGANNSWSGAQTFVGAVVVPTPTSSTHAATKAYVDALGSGLRVKDPVRVATTAALPANSRAGDVLTASANGSINGTGIDGVTTLALNDRVLVKNEATQANNGIFYLSQVGDGSNPWKLTRTTDVDTAAEINLGCYTFVTSGTANVSTSWVQANTVTTINTDAVAFSLFYQGAAYVSSSGITIAGLTISVDQSFSPTWTGAHIFKNSAGVRLDPFSTSTGNTTELRFAELVSNGSNYVGFKAADAITTNTIWTLPSADGSANQYLKTSGAGVLSFATIQSGEITNVTFVTSVSGTSGQVTSTGGLTPVIALAASGVSASTYGSATQIPVFAVDTYGRITSVTNTAISQALLSATHSDTVAGAPVRGSIIIANSTPAWTALGIGSANLVLRSDGSDPSWGQVNVTTDITGIVPLTNGGTGFGTKTAAFNALSALTTKGDILAHDGTDSVRLAVGTNLYVLVADSAQATGLRWASTTSLPVDVTAAQWQARFRNDTSSARSSIWSSNAGFQFSHGAYWSGSAWVHDQAVGHTTSVVLRIQDTYGALWFASSNSSSSWNVADGSTLWDTEGNHVVQYSKGTAYRLYDNLGDYVEITAKSSVTNGTSWSWPGADGSANYVMMTNGSGSLSFAQVTAAMIGSGAALTKTDDTNVTLSLGGSHATALLAAASITVGWAGSLSATRGGTAQSTYATGDTLYASATNTLSKLTIGSTNRFLKSDGTIPGWSGFSMPGSVATNDLLYASNSTQLSTLTSTASRILITDGSGVVGWRNDLPSGTTNNGRTIANTATGNITGDGSTTTFTFTHNLASKTLAIGVWEDSTDTMCRVKIANNGADPTNKVDITFTFAPANLKVFRVRACA